MIKETKIIGVWLKASEVTPTDASEEVYVWPRPYVGINEVTTAFFDEELGGWLRGGKRIKVTHWMKMPEVEGPDGPTEG